MRKTLYISIRFLHGNSGNVRKIFSYSCRDYLLCMHKYTPPEPIHNSARESEDYPYLTKDYTFSNQSRRVQLERRNREQLLRRCACAVFSEQASNPHAIQPSCVAISGLSYCCCQSLLEFRQRGMSSTCFSYFLKISTHFSRIPLRKNRFS